MSTGAIDTKSMHRSRRMFAPRFGSFVRSLPHFEKYYRAYQTELDRAREEKGTGVAQERF